MEKSSQRQLVTFTIQRTVFSVPLKRAVQCLARQISYVTEAIAVHKIRKGYGDPCVLSIYHERSNCIVVSVGEIEIQKPAVTASYCAGNKIDSEVFVPRRTSKGTCQRYAGDNA